MVLQTEYAVAGFIIALLMGTGVGYFVGQSPIAGYKEEIDELETENLHLKELKSQLLEENIAFQDLMEEVNESLTQCSHNYEELQEDYVTLNEKHINLEDDFNQLESSLEILENNYRGLLTSMRIIDAKGYSRTEEFDLPAGQTLRYEYDVGFGIIWVVDISFTHHGGSRFECYISWWQGEQGGLVSGGSDTLEQSLLSITGTVSTDVYDEGDVLFIRSKVNVPDIPRFSRDGSGRLLKKTYEEIKIVVNGDFEEDTWNVVGWETSGHLGAGSGEDSIEGRQLGLVQDLGAVASQTVYLYESDLNLEFYYRPVPRDIPIEFIVYFDDNAILNESFTGWMLPWTSMNVSLGPLMDTYGEHTIKFVVPKNPNCEDESSRVMIDKVSIS